MACFVGCNGHIHTCDTAFESLDCVVLQKIFFRPTRIFYGPRKANNFHLCVDYIGLFQMSNEPTNENSLLFWTLRIFSWVWKIFFANLCNLSFQTPYHTYVHDHYSLQNKPYDKQDRGKKLPNLENRITFYRIIATMLPPFSAPQFSKWTAYLKSRKKSKFF